MKTETPLAIAAQGLSKQFIDRSGWRFWQTGAVHQAVDDVSLEVGRGELFGLLGPNGAGKTTLVKMLCTLVQPTAGQATVVGFPLSDGRAIRRRVGLTVTDERSFYWRLSGRQNLRFFAGLHGIFGQPADLRIAELLDDVALTEAADNRFSNYSSGMRQRLSIARALLPRPELLVLDEPSRSLDPVATNRLHDLILKLQKEQGLTVFLITHDLAEAEKLCRRVAVMSRGRLIAQGTPAEIGARLVPAVKYAVSVAGLPPERWRELARLHPALSITAVGDEATITFKCRSQESLLDDVLRAVRDAGGTIRAVDSRSPSLDEAFQKLISE